MTTMLRLPMVLVALLSALVFSTPAVAQDGDGTRLAAQCVREIHQTSMRARLAIAQTTENTIRRMIALDRQGAEDEAIIRAAREGSGRIDQIATEATNRIRGLVARCTQALEDLEADPALIQRVQEAGARGAAAVQSAAELGQRRIAEALDRLID